MMEQSNAEKFIRHAPCENCGSRDNLAVYDSHSYCFGSHDYQKTNDLVIFSRFLKKSIRYFQIDKSKKQTQEIITMAKKDREKNILDKMK